MTFAPDGRLFVSEKDGALRVIKNGQLLATPFMTLTVNTDNERGLMGIAFDPGFASNRFIYAYYTSTSGSVHNRLSRFTANGDVVVAGSELVLADFPTLGAANHNGGAVHFGLDGKLYVSVGDNAVGSNAQSLTTPLGKLLRFNPDGSIPTDNPFFASATGLARATWALGLRNPFTFEVQPGTGTIFINDVGGGGWEEIDRAQKGANYGWPTTEGNFTNHPEFTQPFFTYPHGGGNTSGNCIAGGAFYNPSVQAFPSSYVGQYFFADYTNNWIRRINPTTGANSVFATGVSGPVDLDVGPDGSLYYLARGSGQVGRVAYAASQPPSIAQQPQNALVSVGQSATFTVSASGQPPLSYQWQRNGTNIAGATATSYVLSNAQVSDSGAAFRAVVSNSFGSTTSAAGVLTVTSNRPPVPTIATPASGATYTAGTNLNFSGSGSDPEDGTLPPSSLTWSILFHHDTHTHPAMSNTTGITSGSWPIPNQGETAANVWYTLSLTVRDAAGLTATATRDIFPVTVPINVTSSPSGLQVLLDGQPATAPIAATGVVGIRRSIGVDSPQLLNGKTWAFSSWSDGGAQVHDVTTPGAGVTYTATFVESSGGGTCFRIQSERSDKWLTVDATAKVVASATAQASGQVFQLVPSGGKFKIQGSGTAFMAVVANQLTMNATSATAEAFTQVPCGFGGRTRYGFTASSGTAPNWKETTLGAPIQSGSGGNAGACNPADGGAWEGFYLEPATCPGGGGPTCSDGVQNQGETGVDCGGPCTACGGGGGAVQLAIASSVSGAFQTSPALSYDNDAGTRYTNDGNLASAFVTYTLSAPASISKVRLLMFNGATRSYPLQIKVGSAVVWSGTPSLGSGFIDVSFTATSGSTLTLTMTGPNGSGSNWFSIFESQIWGTP